MVENSKSGLVTPEACTAMFVKVHLASQLLKKRFGNANSVSYFSPVIKPVGVVLYMIAKPD